VTDHTPLPLDDSTPILPTADVPTGNEGEPDSPVDAGEARPGWYWPLFAAMLLVLAACLMVWPVIVFKAIVP
jgi:hypothetical protein